MTAENGLAGVSSPHTVEETLQRLKTLLRAAQVTVFATVDHSGEAAKAGVRMRPTKLLIFGNPKAGPPVMLASPSAVIDLPLKVLVWGNEHGQVRASSNSPESLQKRHDMPSELFKNLTGVGALVHKAVEH
jgi:uncharacterized protein (DUF302 family)